MANERMNQDIALSQKLDKKPVINGGSFGALGNAAILAQTVSIGDVYNKIFEIPTANGTWTLGVHGKSDRLMLKYIGNNGNQTTYVFNPNTNGGNSYFNAE